MNGYTSIRSILVMLRYAAVIFAVIGVYPMIFRPTGRLRDRADPNLQAQDGSLEARLWIHTEIAVKRKGGTPETQRINNAV